MLKRCKRLLNEINAKGSFTLTSAHAFNFSAVQGPQCSFVGFITTTASTPGIVYQSLVIVVSFDTVCGRHCRNGLRPHVGDGVEAAETTETNEAYIQNFAHGAMGKGRGIAAIYLK